MQRDAVSNSTVTIFLFKKVCTLCFIARSRTRIFHKLIHPFMNEVGLNAPHYYFRSHELINQSWF